MSSEEAEDVEPLPRNRRKSDHRRGVIGAAVKATESPAGVSMARLAMIASPILFSIVIGLTGAMYADLKTSQDRDRADRREFSDKLQQVLINQAVGLTEREDQKRRITKNEEGMTRL